MKPSLQLFFIFTAITLSTCRFSTQAHADAHESNDRGENEFWVAIAQNHYLNSESYAFSSTPYESLVDVNQQVTQHNTFDLSEQESWNVGYLYHFNQHWSLQVDLMHARTEMKGVTAPVDYSFSYHFYNYWESAWGDLVDVEETLVNPRHPTGSYDRYEIGTSLVYSFNIQKIRTSIYGGISYSSLSDGTIHDFYFRTDTLGSRSIRHQSTAFLQTSLEDTNRWGYRVGARLSYPITTRLNLFLDLSLRAYQTTESPLTLTDTDAEYKDWITSDLDQMNELIQLESFPLDATMLSSQIGFSIQL